MLWHTRCDRSATNNNNTYIILCLNNKGKILSCVECLQHQMKHVQAVTIDTEDNIFFAEHFTNKIGKANRNCDRVQVYEVPQARGPGHLAIAVVGNEVMVTEYKNTGQITVYDRELNYVRCITSRGNTRLRCFYPDRHQNLYISDDDKNIQVLNKTGEFLHSFSCSEKLKDPWMVHVSGQHVYVADVKLEKTVVFTTEGHYVTTICCYGGMFVNQDGLLYITNFFNNKVYCY